MAILVYFNTVGVAKTIEVPLYKLSPTNVVDLKGREAQYSIKIPIAERWKVKEAILHLEYINSSVLLDKTSRLVIKLNGYALAQNKLSPVSPEGEVDILLPGRMLKSGYNDLTFYVCQNYAESLACEDPFAPELWTTLKLDDSFLKVEYSLTPVPLRLSAISHFLFDSKIFPNGKVNFIIEKSSANMLKIASIIASGIALKFDYREIFFTVSSDIKSDSDNILIGNKKFVDEFLSQKDMKIDIPLEPFLKIAHLPVEEIEEKGEKHIKKYVKDKKHTILIVSGENLKQLQLAAEAIENMASRSFPFPDTSETRVKNITLPTVYPYMGKLMLNPGFKYSFSDLNFDTNTFKGMRSGSEDLLFRLPTDLFIKPNQYANLYLHLVYGAGMRSDSSLNILLNGKYVRSVHLNDQNGAEFRDYKIAIPTYLFKRGYNKITFRAVLTPSNTGRCKLIQTENLFLTLFGDSSLYLPPMHHWVDLPRMELFFQDGFPFTRLPDGQETLFYLAKSDFKTLSATLNLIGLMTQKIGYPLFNLKFSFQKPQDWKGEMIVLGTVDSIPEDFRKLGPLKLLPVSLAPYPLLKNIKGKPIVSKWEKFKNDFLTTIHHKKVFPYVKMAFSQPLTGIGPNKGAVMEFQSPYETGRSILLLTAISSENLEKLSKVLLEQDVQSMAYGGLSLVDLTPPHYEVNSLRVGKKYYIGKLGHFTKIDLYLYSHFWLFFLLLILAILLLTLTVFYLLKKYRKRRIKNAEEDNSN